MTNPAPQNQGDGAEAPIPTLSPMGMLHAVRKHWLVTAAIVAVVVIGTTFYTLGQKRIYEAEATVYFDPQPPRPLGNQVQTVVDMGAGAVWFNQEYYETQYRVIRSRRVSAGVVRALNLHRDAGFLKNLPPGETGTPEDRPVEAAAMTLRARLAVEPVKDSRLAIVKLRDADPERAQRILNVLVETYIAQNLEDVLASTGSAFDWLQDQQGKLKSELESNEIDLHDYKLDKNILSVSLDDQTNMLRAEIKQLNERLTAARAERAKLQGRVSALDQVAADDPSKLPSSELLASGLLRSFRQEYVNAMKARNALTSEGKGPNHPAVKAAQARIDVTKDALLNEISNIQGAVRRDLQAVSTEVGGLARMLEGAKKRGLQLNLLEIEYNRLKRAKDNTERLYSLVLERTKESDLARMLRFNNIRVVDPPLRPKSPVRPRVPLNIALGLAIGLALGVLAAVSRELLDRTVKTPDDLEKGLGVPFLGLLPSFDSVAPERVPYGRKKKRRRRRRELPPLTKPELVVHEQPTSGIAEAARSIRTNIVFMSPDRPFRTLLVTSAGPFEGKTMASCCMATAMAQAGQRVVLVDCDLRRPRVHRVFDAGKETGVTTVLLDRSALDDALKVVQTGVPNLSVLPSGPLPPNPSELLHSEAFGTFLDDLLERFDRVVIDTPPVVPVTDAAILSARSDATLLVVRAFETRKEMARQAVRALRDVGGRLAGSILNAVDLGRHEYNYYQYYYYKREGYAPEEEPGEDAA